jgi:hypothetical protein
MIRLLPVPAPTRPTPTCGPTGPGHHAHIRPSAQSRPVLVTFMVSSLNNVLSDETKLSLDGQ